MDHLTLLPNILAHWVPWGYGTALSDLTWKWCQMSLSHSREANKLLSQPLSSPVNHHRASARHLTILFVTHPMPVIYTTILHCAVTNCFKTASCIPHRIGSTSLSLRTQFCCGQRLTDLRVIMRKGQAAHGEGSSGSTLPLQMSV